MKFNKITLENGLRVITIPMIDNPSVTVLVMVEAGSKYENKENNGISHFLEHMVFKGTPKRPKAVDISHELDSIGANYNAFTTQEFTGYYAKADSRHLDKIIDVVSDMYLNPLFDKNEIEKEKGVIVEEIRMYQDLPQQHVQDLLLELLYGDTPAGWNIAGTENNVKSFNRDLLIDYRSSNYLPQSTMVVIAGSFDEKSIIQKVKEAFVSIKDGKKQDKLSVIDKQDRPMFRSEYEETDQTHLCFGVRTFAITDKRIPAMLVLTTILGRGMSSRLFTKMRTELGICYYIKADHNPFTDHGVLTIAAGVDNSRVGEAIKGVIDECVMLKEEAVSSLEMKKVKDYIAGTTMLELETSDARAEFCGYQETLKGKIDSPELIIEKVNAVTAEDVQNLAKEIFINQNLNLASVGRLKEGDQALSFLKF